MHVLITVAGGLIGQKMSHALLEQGKVVMSDKPARKIALLTLLDLVKPAIPPNTLSNQVVARVACDISNSTALKNAFEPTPDLVFHLAAVVSLAAEKNFDLGICVSTSKAHGMYLKRVVVSSFAKTTHLRLSQFGGGVWWSAPRCYP